MKRVAAACVLLACAARVRNVAGVEDDGVDDDWSDVVVRSWYPSGVV